MKEEQESVSTSVRDTQKTVPFMKFAGLFAGIGGFELGLTRAGHDTELLCDVLPAAEAVLRRRFPDTEYHGDIRTLKSLPSGVDAICCGFPCQDLSQAGRGAGLTGEQSRLVEHLFRLLRRRRIATVVLENVPFMLQIHGGAAIRAILNEFEVLRYRWAYRTVDTFAFGLPQRRRRVFLVASREIEPSDVLFSDESPLERPKTSIGQLAHGFYWTEGRTGLGWAVDCVPTLKNGSALGIPSPPAILMPDGRIVKPSIEDAERLQGFAAGWTSPVGGTPKRSPRWSLVGNAVSVPVAKWLGKRLMNPGQFDKRRDSHFPSMGTAPKAARYDGRNRHAVDISTDPLGHRPRPLAEFLRNRGEPLPLGAAQGFLLRTRRSTLRFEEAFIHAMERHIVLLGGKIPSRRPMRAAAG